MRFLFTFLTWWYFIALGLIVIVGVRGYLKERRERR